MPQLGSLDCLEPQLLGSCLSLLCPGFQLLAQALSARQLLLCLQCPDLGTKTLNCVYSMVKYEEQPDMRQGS